MYLESRPKVN